MKKLDERGSIGIIVLLILFFLSTAGLTVMIMSGTDLKTAYNVYWKGKSDALVDFALEEYKKRVNELFLQNDAYETDEIDLDKINSEPFIVNENGKKKAEIKFFGVKFDSISSEIKYQYLDDITNKKL